jgi:macrolide-specific efflux system membrane fusion protein
VTVLAALHENVLFVHPSGVRQFAGRAFVVLQDGDRQRRVDVTLGLANDQQVEITSGLREGDLVISP